MCGIVGYIGKEQNSSILINALKELEYRGYDSCGIVTDGGQEKSLGSPDKLTLDVPFKIGIGHTRWATHGSVSLENTHPIQVGDVYVVCNGVIENAASLKKTLEKDLGCQFTSETDTEVIAHTFSQYSGCCSTEAIKCTVEKLVGEYAFLLLHNNRIYFANSGLPLNIYFESDPLKAATGSSLFFSSSDVDIDYSYVVRLDNECGYVKNNLLPVVIKDGPSYLGISYKCEDEWSIEKYRPIPNSLKLEGYSSYMEKEIYEQPKVIGNTIKSFQEFDFNHFLGYDSYTLIGCGSSYNACLVGKYFLEHMGIPCNVELASEFYPVTHMDTLLIAVSQSGETADTLKAYMGYTGKKLAICNRESTMSRLGETIFTNVGEERGVASTKTFSAQCVVFYMLSQLFASFPTDPVPEWLKWDSNILDDLPERVSKFKKFAFIGSGMFYPLALEAALKFKELTYIPAQGYAAGEMKHGPLALADEDLCVFSLGNNPIAEAELRARGAHVIVSPGDKICDFFQTLVQIQLTAMLVASKMGHDVDKPRNLAKSVTVR